MFGCLDGIGSDKKLFVIIHLLYIWIPIKNRLEEQQDKRRRQRALPVTANAIDLTGDRDDQVYFSLVPPYPAAAKLYTLISSLIHAAIVLQPILVPILDRSAGSNVYACHMARFPMHPALIPPDRMVWLAATLSLCHIIWRYVLLVVEKKFDLDLIPFLLSDEQSLRKRIDQRSCRNPFFIERPQNSLDELLFVRLHGSKWREQQQFLLRFNRTLEARATMLGRLHLVFKASILFALFYSLIWAPIGLYLLVFDQESMYAGCEINIQDAAYRTRLISSFVVLVILSLDTLCGLAAPSSMAFLLTSDLMTYWLDLEPRIERLERMMAMFKATPRAPADERARAMTQITAAGHEMQVTLVDFFTCLRRVDRFISIALALIIIIWLIINSVVTLTKDFALSASESPLIRSLQIVAVVVLCIQSHWMLGLKRRTERAYTLICSMIALDPSVHRAGWSGVLQFYTHSRYAYTVLHSQIYTSLIVIKLISYTFTSMLFVDKIKNEL